MTHRSTHAITPLQGTIVHPISAHCTLLIHTHTLLSIMAILVCTCTCDIQSCVTSSGTVDTFYCKPPEAQMTRSIAMPYNSKVKCTHDIQMTSLYYRTYIAMNSIATLQYCHE